MNAAQSARERPVSAPSTTSAECPAAIDDQRVGPRKGPAQAAFVEAALACLDGRKPFPNRPVRDPLPQRPHAPPCSCETCRQWARVIVAAPRLHPTVEGYTLSAARARLHQDASEDEPEYDDR